MTKVNYHLNDGHISSITAAKCTKDHENKHRVMSFRGLRSISAIALDAAVCDLRSQAKTCKSTPLQARTLLLHSHVTLLLNRSAFEGHFWDVRGPSLEARSLEELAGYGGGDVSLKLQTYKNKWSNVSCNASLPVVVFLSFLASSNFIIREKCQQHKLSLCVKNTTKWILWARKPCLARPSLDFLQRLECRVKVYFAVGLMMSSRSPCSTCEQFNGTIKLEKIISFYSNFGDSVWKRSTRLWTSEQKTFVQWRASGSDVAFKTCE